MFLRGIPDDRPCEQFINRKGFNSLNVLVTGGVDHRIYDLVNTAPGSYHDAAIWAMSAIKPYLERQFPREHVLGDSGLQMFIILFNGCLYC